MARFSRQGSIVIVALAAVAVTALTACTGSSSKSSGSGGTNSGGAGAGGALTMAWPLDPKVYNGQLYPNTPAARMLSLVYDRLITYDGTGKLVGDLASSWEASPDGQMTTFHLSKNVKWQDGEPYNADDVVWFLNLAKTEPTSFGGTLKAMTGVTSPDPYTVVVNFSQFTNPDIFANYTADTLVLPKHIFGNGDIQTNPHNTDPIGTGPFAWKSYQPDQYVQLVPNPNYFGQVPALANLTLQFIPNASSAIAQLQGGSVQLLSDQYTLPVQQLKQLKSDSRIQVHQVPSDVVPRIVFNGRPNAIKTNPWLSNLQVRQAFESAIDFRALTQQALAGFITQSWGPYAISLPIYDKNLPQPTYSIAKANQLLDEAGYPKKGDGVRFTADLPYIPYFGTPELAQAVAGMLSQVGIKINLVTADYKTFLAKYWTGPDGLGDTPLALYIGPTGEDPFAALSLLYDSSHQPVLNGQGTSIPEVDALFADAGKTLDEKRRTDDLTKVQQIMAQDLPAIWLGSENSIYLASKSVQNLNSLGAYATYPFYSGLSVSK